MNNYYRKVKASSDRYAKAHKRLYSLYRMYAENNSDLQWYLDCLCHEYADRKITRLDMLDVKAHILVSKYS